MFVHHHLCLKNNMHRWTPEERTYHQCSPFARTAHCAFCSQEQCHLLHLYLGDHCYTVPVDVTLNLMGDGYCLLCLQSFLHHLSVISLNVRSLRQNIKHKALFLFAKQQKSDFFFFFQESHSVVNDASFWKAQWGNDMVQRN